jgi:hypothetical protein
MAVMAVTVATVPMVRLALLDRRALLGRRVHRAALALLAETVAMGVTEPPAPLAPLEPPAVPGQPGGMAETRRS